MEHNQPASHRDPWNKGKIVGQKAPLKLKDIWALRVRLQMASGIRELALFNLGIDSKLRGCDLVKLKVRDVSTVISSPPARSSCSRRLSDRSSSRSRNPLATRCKPGSSRPDSGQMTSSSRAVFMTLRIWARVNTHESWRDRSASWAWRPQPTGRIRSDEPRRP